MGENTLRRGLVPLVVLLVVGLVAGPVAAHDTTGVSDAGTLSDGGDGANWSENRSDEESFGTNDSESGSTNESDGSGEESNASDGDDGDSMNVSDGSGEESNASDGSAEDDANRTATESENGSAATMHAEGDDGDRLSAPVERTIQIAADVLSNDVPERRTHGSPDGSGAGSPFLASPLGGRPARVATAVDESGELVDSSSLAGELDLVELLVVDDEQSDAGAVVHSTGAARRGGMMTFAASGAPTTPPSDALPEGTAVGAGAGALAVAAALRQGTLTGANAAPAVLAAAAVPATVVHDAFDRLLRVFYPLRYSRYDDSDPLEHDTRRQVYEVVEEAPGTYLSEVAERADVALSTARHHVRVLEREDVVASAKVRGKRRFYPGEADGIELAAAMDDGPTAAVLDALARLGPCSVSALAEELDRDSSTVTHHLQRLDEDDLVVREREGRSVVNRLAPAVRGALDHEHPEAASGRPAPADD